VNVDQLPGLVFSLRSEMANLLRAAAQGEEPFVARRLREIAAAFEVGVGPGEVRRGTG
jgi:hypothetical protein